MKSLFGDNRIANILNILRKGSSMSLTMLADKLSVSERSIRNDIKLINDELKSAGIIEITSGICSLRIFDQQSFKKAYSQIMNTNDLMNSSRARINYIFGKLMRAVSPVLTDDLAYEMNVGRSTLVKDLKKLREEIEPYHLSIVGKTSKGLMLQGSELDIRQYVIENNYDEIYEDYPLDEDLIEIINKTFEVHPFEREVRKSFYKYFTLMLDRFLTGHFVGRLPEKYYSLTARGGFVFVDRTINRVGSFLSCEFPIEEKIYLLLPIIGMRTPLDSDNLYDIELDHEVGNLMNKILERIDQELNVQFDPTDFANEFQYHLMFMINRLRYGIHVDNPLIEEIQQKYPLAYQMAQISSHVIKENCGLDVNQSELGFLASYFGVFIEVNNLSRPKQSIAVVCGAGVITSRLLFMQLKKILDDQSKITVFSLDQITAQILNRYDLVLTTVDIPFECQVPVLAIQEIFDEEELKHKIEKAKFVTHNKTVIDDNLYLLTNLIQEENFFDLSDYSYTDGLNFIMDCLYEDGAIDQGFKERLWKREEQGSMAFNQMVAIPHTIQTKNDEITIAAGVFHQGTIYRDNNIRFVLLIAIPVNIEDDHTTLIRIYDEILTLVKDEEMVDKIANSTNYTDFCKALYKRF